MYGAIFYPIGFSYVKPYYSRLCRSREMGIAELAEHCWEVCIHHGKLPSIFDGLLVGEHCDLPGRSLTGRAGSTSKNLALYPGQEVFFKQSRASSLVSVQVRPDR